ncbi:hypothetical protein B296_00000192 [Ensete ventricosum]|uniref:Uncharacterized protein n=1 Tax=Ensete ventricosum TaxID=4639 RepID=A0A427BC45_ENSVE|nr:hypothetical protein B296_00000192 [Ensete ventricosum]
MPPTERTHLFLPRCLKRKRTIERNQAINGDGNINSVVRPAGAPSCHESYSSGVAWAWGACDQNVFLPFATTRRRWTIEGNDISTAACCFIQAKLQRMIAIPVVVPSQARLVGVEMMKVALFSPSISCKESVPSFSQSKEKEARQAPGEERRRETITGS